MGTCEDRWYAWCNGRLSAASANFGWELARMDATDAADSIQEAADEAKANERFRKRAALAIGTLAMLLAIASLGGDNAGQEVTQANILATDTWAFYQARNIRQTATQLAADELEVLLATRSDLTAEARAELQRRLEQYQATVARFESDPVGGEGKRELALRARAHEADRARAEQQDNNFDYAQAMFQIAIVLGSVSIVAVSRRLLLLCLALGAAGIALTVNGFFLLVGFPAG